MNRGLDDIGWSYFGALLASASDIEQTKFFKAFVKELDSICGTNFQAESQLAAINIRLTPAERERLQMLGYDEK